jgi:predicted transposase YdaD
LNWPTESDIVGLIQDIIVYKFPRPSRKEIEAMFGLSELRKTRYYQEVAAEVKVRTKLESVPRLISLGLTIEQIAQALELDEALIRSTLESAPSQG